jgi:imidazoleglycerol-phosphate dehydratase
MVGNVPTSLISHFFESWTVASKSNLHARVFYGNDDHHQSEAMFKALGRSLRKACQLDSRRGDMVPSTKGTLS